VGVGHLRRDGRPVRERKESFTTDTGQEVDPLYTPADIPTTTTVRIWGTRVRSRTRAASTDHAPRTPLDDAPVRGMGTAAETNERFNYLIDQGSSGSRWRSTSRPRWGTTPTRRWPRARWAFGRRYRHLRRLRDRLRRDPARRGVHVDDDQRPRRRPPRDVHCDGR